MVEMGIVELFAFGGSLGMDDENCFWRNLIFLFYKYFILKF